MHLCGQLGLQIVNPNKVRFLRNTYNAQINERYRIDKSTSMIVVHGVRVRDYGWLACVGVQSGDVERFRVVQGDVAAVFGRLGFDRVVLSGSRSRML